VLPAVSEIQLFKNWVFFPRSEFFLFISLFLLNIVKNTRPMRKVKGNELERWNLGKINENKFSAHQTSRIGPKPIK
jgi:hypothetical protein